LPFLIQNLVSVLAEDIGCQQSIGRQQPVNVILTDGREVLRSVYFRPILSPSRAGHVTSHVITTFFTTDHLIRFFIIH
jgi:hypothetical protein